MTPEVAQEKLQREIVQEKMHNISCREKHRINCTRETAPAEIAQDELHKINCARETTQ